MSLPDTLDDLFPQLAEITEEEKIKKIARHMPCDSCSCQGWKPGYAFTSCVCSHDAKNHLDNKEDWERRLKVALRLEELLKVQSWHCLLFCFESLAAFILNMLM
jgi:histone acetyltransferase